MDVNASKNMDSIISCYHNVIYALYDEISHVVILMVIMQKKRHADFIIF